MPQCALRTRSRALWRLKSEGGGQRAGLNFKRLRQNLLTGRVTVTMQRAVADCSTLNLVLIVALGVVLINYSRAPCRCECVEGGGAGGDAASFTRTRAKMGAPQPADLSASQHAAAALEPVVAIPQPLTSSSTAAPSLSSTPDPSPSGKQPDAGVVAVRTGPWLPSGKPQVVPAYCDVFATTTDLPLVKMRHVGSPEFFVSIPPVNVFLEGWAKQYLPNTLDSRMNYQCAPSNPSLQAEPGHTPPSPPAFFLPGVSRTTFEAGQPAA